jgi:hypothetical protein
VPKSVRNRKSEGSAEHLHDSAPIDGRIGLIAIKEGNDIKANEAWCGAKQ